MKQAIQNALQYFEAYIYIYINEEREKKYETKKNMYVYRIYVSTKKKNMILNYFNTYAQKFSLYLYILQLKYIYIYSVCK